MPDLSFDYDRVSTLVKLALIEDIGTGDVTSEAVASPSLTATIRFVARQSAVIAGLPLLEPIFREISRDTTCHLHVVDGDHVNAAQVLATVQGPARSLLAGERLALNFLQRLSGVATLTDLFVQAVSGTSARIFDTRKTTPGLRYLEKYAVRVAGGHNHRMGLYDQVLLKDNHLTCLAATPGADSLANLISRLRSHIPDMLIEVEVESLDALDGALDARPDVVLLDNMNLPQLSEAVKRTHARGQYPLLECSGGVTIASVAAIAGTGVDRISIGRLTHSAPAIDIAADLVDIKETQ